MQYQLPNGKVVHLTVDQYLDLTDEDIQYMMSIDHGDYVLNPFSDSAIGDNIKEKYYDFDYLVTDDENPNDVASDDIPFDDIIDLTGPLDT